MPTRYHFHDEHPLYFATMTVVAWVDIFTRIKYVNMLYDSWHYCQQNKGLHIHAYVIMTNHVHLLVSSESEHLSHIFRDMKKYTSKQIVADLRENVKESRRKWMVDLFEFAGKTHPNQQGHQFWQHTSHPIPLWNPAVIRQKLDYIHNNPVKAGWVDEAWHYRHSSARVYRGMKGVIDVDMLWVP